MGRNPFNLMNRYIDTNLWQMLILTDLLDLGSSCTFPRCFRNVTSEMLRLATIRPSWPSDLGLPTCRCPGLETTAISSLPPYFELAWGTTQSLIGFAELRRMLHWFFESPLDRKLRLCVPIVHHGRVCTRLARSRWTRTILRAETVVYPFKRQFLLVFATKCQKF